jgi:sulfur-oxidizing protein SoxZ
MTIPTRIKTRQKDGVTEILCRVNHPMEAPRCGEVTNNEKGVAHFIQKLIFEAKGKQILEADLGATISKDPVFIVRVSGLRAGDSVAVRWTDNKGQKGSASTTIA